MYPNSGVLGSKKLYSNFTSGWHSTSFATLSRIPWAVPTQKRVRLRSASIGDMIVASVASCPDSCAELSHKILRAEP